MSALSDNYEAKRQDGDIISYEIKEDEDIYKGAITTTTDANGYLYAGADSASITFQGIAVEKSLSSSVTTDGDGIRSVRVFRTGVFQLATGQTANQAWVGFKVYITDSGTVDLVGTPNNDCLVGVCVSYVSANVIKVDIDGAASDGA